MPQPRGWPTRGQRAGIPVGWSLNMRGFSVSGFAAAAVLLAAGSPASAQTLTEALAYAYQNNPQLLAQRASLRASDEEVPVALSGWRPTVNLTSQAGFNQAEQTANSSITGNPNTQSG